jgi:photosystem II stability/assembly factor-like uncharacterized protein
MYGQKSASNAPAMEEIQMVDMQSGWARTRDDYVLLRTSDGGTSWRDFTPVNSSGDKIRVVRIAALPSNIAWVVAGGMQKAPGSISTSSITNIFHTVDGGRTWKSVAIPSPGDMSISFINPREGWILAVTGAWAGSEAVDIYHSTDGGGTWDKVASDEGPGPHGPRPNSSSGISFGGDKDAITFLNSATGWITLGSGGMDRLLYLYVTHDSGHTWRLQSLPVPRELTPHWQPSLPWPAKLKFFTARDGILSTFWGLLTDSGQQTGTVIVFYATHDGGTTWTYTAPVHVNMSDFAYQAVADMDHAWVLNGSVLRTTSDGGGRWTAMASNPLLADVMQLDFISSQVGWAVRQTNRFVAGGGPTFPYLLKTLNGGRTWTPVPYAILQQ